MEKRRVAVIGAGVSGLVSIKTCLEEGLEPVCFERDSHIGGLWMCYEDIGSDPTGPASIYEGLITNVCKEMMAFSDFSFPKSDPPYLTRELTLQYLIRYAEKFNLSKHINFNTTVLEISQSPDFQQTGRWTLRTQRKDEDIKTDVFDAVMVCNGVNSSAIFPLFPGQNEYKGRIIHARHFRRGEDFKDKTILVVGAAHSAGDIAVLSTEYAKKVYISMRDGTWIFPRIMGKLPTDAYGNQRWKDAIPACVYLPLMKRKLTSMIDYKGLGIQCSKHPANSTSMMINDLLPVRIMSGHVVIRSGLKGFDGSRVIFDDDSFLDDVDCVIFATGYNAKTPFMDNSIMFDSSNRLELYKHVIPPRLEHPTLAAIGYVRSRGALGPTAELQVRYAIKVFKREVALPSCEEMLADIKRVKDASIAQYGAFQPKVLPTKYNDELAQMIGALPSFWSLLSDPTLAYYFYFTPAYPPCYRLVGPHATPDARERLMKCGEALNHGVTLKTVRPRALGHLKELEANKTLFKVLLFFGLLVIILAIIF